MLEAEVTNVDKEERRISLSMKPSRGAGKSDYAEYMEESSSAVTFGELMQAQLTDESDE